MARRIDVHKHELWKQRLLRFRQSKVSVAEFCRSERISQASFYQWRRRLDGNTPRTRNVNDTRDLKAEHFVPMEVTSAPSRLQLSFPNGVELMIDAQDPLLLQAVLQAVAAVRVTRGEL